MKAHATIRTQPADFKVFEIMNIPWSGDGEHLWLRVEKTAMNTAWLKKDIARASGCPERDIAHSGLKDRHAVTEQWLSLPWKYRDALPSCGDGWRILEYQRHQKKLRIGTHRANRFVLTLRDVQGERAAIDSALADLRDQGFANAFGVQRFGRDNLAWAREWVARGVLPKKHDERGRVLSVLRAWLFNCELEVRGERAREILSGDRAMLAGSHSHFAVEAVDDALRARAQSGDIAPGGWLAGKGEVPLAGEAGAIRAPILAEEAAMLAYLQAHAESDWRPMWLRARDVQWQWQDDATLVLDFILPAGAFATTLLDALFAVQDASRPASASGETA
ncbi:MAG: tRNA pseudouridine(13) synthase TruD [Cardiobacteriaceae bacterium]|nr:tRNA pseudouridine(13) synthase TruD [Cardiobacteriaceae bacterium]